MDVQHTASLCKNPSKNPSPQSWELYRHGSKRQSLLQIKYKKNIQQKKTHRELDQHKETENAFEEAFDGKSLVLQMILGSSSQAVGTEAGCLFES